MTSRKVILVIVYYIKMLETKELSILVDNNKIVMFSGKYLIYNENTFEV